MTLATCIGCGCADDFACWDDSADAPCHWLEIDRHAGLGVCSCCPDHQARWQAGDRSSRAPAISAGLGIDTTADKS